MPTKKTPKPISAGWPRHVITTSANGNLVTVTSAKGIHIMTMRRAAAIKSGLLKPKR